MGKLNVIIVDATGNKEQKVGLPDDIKCGIIMVKLVEKIKLPSVGPDGNPISYKFIHKVTGRQLLESQTLGEAGIKDGDVLRLQPEITAGAVCSQCGNSEPEGNSFCSKCGSPLSAVTQVEQDTVPPAYTQPNPVENNAVSYTNIIPKANKKPIGAIIFDILGLISGVISVILGFVISGYTAGNLETFTSYGGDAYTGIQNAAAQTANNVMYLTKVIKFGFTVLLIVLGIVSICYFGSKFIDKIKNKVK